MQARTLARTSSAARPALATVSGGTAQHSEARAHLAQHLQQLSLLELLPQRGVDGKRDVALLQLQEQVLAQRRRRGCLLPPTAAASSARHPGGLRPAPKVLHHVGVRRQVRQHLRLLQSMDEAGWAGKQRVIHGSGQDECHSIPTHASAS